MITLIYQVSQTTRMHIVHMVNHGHSAEEAFSTHNVSIELKEDVLNPKKKQVVKEGIFDVDGFAKQYKNAIGY